MAFIHNKILPKPKTTVKKGQRVEMQDEKALEGGKPKRKRNKQSDEIQKHKTTVRFPSKSTRTEKRWLLIVKEKLKPATLTKPLVWFYFTSTYKRTITSPFRLLASRSKPWGAKTVDIHDYPLCRYMNNETKKYLWNMRHHAEPRPCAIFKIRPSLIIAPGHSLQCSRLISFAAVRKHDGCIEG